MHGVDDPATRNAVRAYVKLNRATRAILAAVEGRVTRCGLTLTQLGVLEAILHPQDIADSFAGLTQAELAELDRLLRKLGKGENELPASS